MPQAEQLPQLMLSVTVALFMSYISQLKCCHGHFLKNTFEFYNPYFHQCAWPATYHLSSSPHWSTLTYYVTFSPTSSLRQICAQLLYTIILIHNQLGFQAASLTTFPMPTMFQAPIHFDSTKTTFALYVFHYLNHYKITNMGSHVQYDCASMVVLGCKEALCPTQFLLRAPTTSPSLT